MRRLTVPITAALALALLAGLAACSQKSPEERIAEIRSHYTAEVNQGGFYVKQEPALAAELDPQADAEPEEAADIESDQDAEIVEDLAAAEGDAADVVAPAGQDVVLDILVRHDSARKLPGVTVDIVQEDPQGNEKDHWTLWVETADLEKGTIKQVSHELIGIDYEEGDRFAVEVRHPIPPEERGDYREFSMESL